MASLCKIERQRKRNIAHRSADSQSPTRSSSSSPPLLLLSSLSFQKIPQHLYFHFNEPSRGQTQRTRAVTCFYIITSHNYNQRTSGFRIIFHFQMIHQVTRNTWRHSFMMNHGHCNMSHMFHAFKYYILCVSHVVYCCRMLCVCLYKVFLYNVLVLCVLCHVLQCYVVCV